ncbi:MAG: peptidylprolyl isomerase [Bryobacteraceae bacterium]|nr:peptidylprolyl isomerase [Bryobacteraceae bacterium]MDW8377635.1 peptidylprolyl isomerase [Bryobacterales bacterium]
MKRAGFAAGIFAGWRLYNGWILALPLVASAAWPAESVHVILETALGQIEVAVNAKRAPITAANFLRYVDAGLYDGGAFHRSVRLDNQPNDTIKIEVIQAAADHSRRNQFFEMIPLEPTSLTGLKHRDGTISMARTKPNTARHDFFICLGDQPSLDFGGMRNPDRMGFAAFGKVVKGMDVVRRIHQSPTRNQKLTPPILIHRAYRKR